MAKNLAKKEMTVNWAKKKWLKKYGRKIGKKMAEKFGKRNG